METADLGTRIAAAKREIRSRSTDGVERRTFSTLLEVRATVTGWQIVGHGIVYNVLSENLGGFREMVAEGAATDVLASNPDVRGLINHNPDLLLGRTTAGTMTLEDDPPTGLRYIIDPPDVSYANDLHVSMDRGDINQSSFAFRIARGGDIWEEDEETGLLIRTIIKFSGLYDMSPVTYPAYPTTDSGVASHQPSAHEPELAPEGELVVPVPTVERTDDEPAEAARPDGDGEDQQAGEPVARNERAERLRIRIGEPPL
jgi:HK97 family phage prohead protease